MGFNEFKQTLTGINPPSGISIYLQSLWYDAKGDWEKAHQLADSIETKDAFNVHAYLHRKEGDPSNAGYWYKKAGVGMPTYSLEKEWEELVVKFIS